MTRLDHDTVPAALDALHQAPSAPAPPVWGAEAEALWAELQKVPQHHAPHLGEALVQAGRLAERILDRRLPSAVLRGGTLARFRARAG